MPNPEHPYYLLSETCRQHQATLVAVSKTRPVTEIEMLYHMGQRVFAENRAQELVEKAPVLPKDIEWHLIGHLQTNKVRSIMPYVSCIQSLDRLNLWDKIQEEAARSGKKIKCLLQIKIAAEETKYGWSVEELNKILMSGKHHTCPDVIICGVMGMASLTEDMAQVRNEMKSLKASFDVFKAQYFKNDPVFNIISMGMSGDYSIALDEGSTMIRIGSLLFN
ncbi:MAG TPA: YggS family pyridoxal phosphate-dependent enzyme [Saprospiraceae bacterium]|nr:YggS family pyridoxal phosphate-dependent enzyme [Saprospiraceae bacterium]